MTPLIERYLDMIRIPSVTGNEGPMAAYVAKALENLGLTVSWSFYRGGDRWPSLWTKLPGTDPGAPSLLLLGHLDTVAVAEGWQTDPFVPVQSGDRVYGLGACDMKGGLAAMLDVAARLRLQGPPLRGTLKLAFASDEEGLSRGTFQLLQDGLGADMALVAECRFREAALGFRGRFGITVRVRGESAHASRYPAVGKNAVLAASRLVEALEALPTAVSPSGDSGSWCVRHIEGGIRETLSVPDRCDIFVDRYVVPGETGEGCLAQIHEAARRLDLEDRVEARLMPRETPPMESFSLDPTHPLPQTVAQHFREITGTDLAFGMDPSVCDANYLAVLGGMPTLTFGPSGAGLHAPNEYGSLREIEEATEILLRTAQTLLA